MDYVILRISMLIKTVGGKTSEKPRSNMPIKRPEKGRPPAAAAPLGVYRIGMLGLGFSEVLPPTVIMTMDIRNMT